jgi:site-specific DNA-methyltransferase (adenine-specific)
MRIGEKELARLPAHLQRLFVKLPNHGSEEVLQAFPDGCGQSGPEIRTRHTPKTDAVYGAFGEPSRDGIPHDPPGSAARFFYTAKADAEDRIGSKHPTVKPLDLKQYLCRLITPPGGTVLDCFAGTGTTGEAAWREGLKAILIEREPEYQADIARRMDLVLKPTKRAAVAKSKGKLMGAEGTPLFSTDAA